VASVTLDALIEKATRSEGREGRKSVFIVAMRLYDALFRQNSTGRLRYVRIARRSASRDSKIDRKKPRRKVERSPRGINPTHAENYDYLRSVFLAFPPSLSLSLSSVIARIMDMKDKIFSRAARTGFIASNRKEIRAN